MSPGVVGVGPARHQAGGLELADEPADPHARQHDALGKLTGDLTIKGEAHPLVLDVDYVGHAADPWGNERVVFSARGSIDRERWGLTWNMVLDTGGLLVSKTIGLEIEVELIRQDP